MGAMEITVQEIPRQSGKTCAVMFEAHVLYYVG